MSRGCGAGVGDRDAPDLGVVLGRDDDLERRGERAVAAHELGAILGEHHVVAVGPRAARLVAGRPHLAAVDVAQEDVAAPVVARRVLAPARHGDARPSGCSPSRRPSASPSSGRWTADARAGWRRADCAGGARRRGSRSSTVALAPTSSARGWATATSRGVRSCSSSSVAWTIGSAWKRVRITPSSSALAIATIVMPWWWAM